MKKIVFALIAAAALLVACEPPVVHVTGVTLSKTTASVIEGETTQLNVIVNPTDAANKEVTWSSSSSAIATVDPNGLVTGVKEGEATITVTSVDTPAATASCKVTVTKRVIPVESVTVTPEKKTLKPTETVKLTAVVTPSDATYTDVVWKSSNTKVATVAADGTVTAVADGEASITATASQQSDKVSNACVITVHTPVARSMFARFNDMLIRVGQGYDNQTVWYGTVDDYANRDDIESGLTWTSADPNVADTEWTDDKGNKHIGVHGVNPGKTTFTVSDEDGNKVQFPVEVLAAASIPEGYNYGMELVPTHKEADIEIFTKDTHGKLSMGPGYVDGTQCIHVKDFGRSDPSKFAYTLFSAKFSATDISEYYNTGNAALYIRLYVNDVSKLCLDGSFAQIELTSSGSYDEEEYAWVGGKICKNWPAPDPQTKFELKNGWNNIVLPFNFKDVTGGEIRPKKVNFIRMYNHPTVEYDLTGSGLEIAIDQIRIVDWTEFDKVENFDRWFDGGTGNNRPTYRWEDSFEGHDGVFKAKDDLIAGPISNFRLKEYPGRVYAMPTNMDSSNAVMTYWIWIDDPDFFNKCWLTSELACNNVNDNDDFAFTLNPLNAGEMNLVKGWNKIVCPFSSASHVGTTNYTEYSINYFRIFFTPESSLKPVVGRHTYRIDDIRITKK